MLFCKAGFYSVREEDPVGLLNPIATTIKGWIRTG